MRRKVAEMAKKAEGDMMTLFCNYKDAGIAPQNDENVECIGQSDACKMATFHVISAQVPGFGQNGDRIIHRCISPELAVFTSRLGFIV